MNRLSVIEMAHERSLFVSRRSRGLQLNWVVVDKEAFVVLRPFQRLDHLMWDDMNTYTDHSKIVYIFNPQACGVTPSKPTM